MIKTFSQIIDSRRDFLVDVRRHLHRNPELSGCEKNTTRYLAGLIDAENLPFHIGPGDRGVIVDLACVERVDSVGLGVLVGGKVHMRKTCRVLLSGAASDVHAVLRQCALDTLFPSYFDLSQAIDALDPPKDKDA